MEKSFSTVPTKRAVKPDRKTVGLIVRDLLSESESGLRLVVVWSSLLFLALVFTGRLVWIISTNPKDEVIIHNAGPQDNVRQSILDRRGHVIAGDVLTYSLAIDPLRFRKAGQPIFRAVTTLGTIFPDLDQGRLTQQLEKRDKLFLVQRRVVPSVYHTVLQAGIAGAQLIQEQTRNYPYEDLFTAVIGYTDVDNRGLAGVEKGYQEELLRDGDGVQITIDARYQLAVYEALLRGVNQTKARSGLGVVMASRGGGILAMVSLPTGDPHKPGGLEPRQQFNYAAQRYEMGSTFKIFNTALALESGIDPETTFDVRKRVRIAEYEISDKHLRQPYLSASDILVYSSNAGSAQIALQIGKQKQKEFLANLGLLDPTGLHLPELSVPQYPYAWSNPELATISFGHGIAVTPLHLVAAVAAVTNGGLYYTPALIMKGGSKRVEGRRVISSKTSHIMRQLLMRVVQEGTGLRARVPGLAIGGKTGTAEKIDSAGGYSADRLLSSFVSIYPGNDPEITVLVMLDEPQGSTGEQLSGGQAVAPIAAEIIKTLAPLIAIESRKPASREPDADVITAQADPATKIDLRLNGEGN